MGNKSLFVVSCSFLKDADGLRTLKLMIIDSILKHLIVITYLMKM